jgi:hypothetical protein
MMRTDELIKTLAADSRPVTRPTPRVVVAMAVGGAVALIGLIVALGSPIEPIAERGIARTVGKMSYPLAVGVLALAAALAAGRPSMRFERRAALLALPVLAVAVAAAVDLANAPVVAWYRMLFGSTTVRCFAAVTLGSIPAFAALAWAFRVLAPTRLPAAGFLIGLAAGGVSAAAYALYCREGSTAFLLATYTPAMLIPALAGGLLGASLLRW